MCIRDSADAAANAEPDGHGLEHDPTDAGPYGAEVEHDDGSQGADVWAVLENGIRDIYGEVRNSLDFHRSQDGGGDVSHVVLSGAAQSIPGFADALQAALGVEVRREELVFSGNAPAGVTPNRLAVAAGLATEEVGP